MVNGGAVVEHEADVEHVESAAEPVVTVAVEVAAAGLRGRGGGRCSCWLCLFASAVGESAPAPCRILWVPIIWSWALARGLRAPSWGLMCRILYRFLALLVRLAVRSGRSKDLEIIVLRHQLGMLHRRNNRPQLADEDRAPAGCCRGGPAPIAASWLARHTRDLAALAPTPNRPSLDPVGTGNSTVRRMAERSCTDHQSGT